MPSLAETKVKWILGLLDVKPGKAILDISKKPCLPRNSGHFDYIINTEYPENLTELENYLRFALTALRADGKAAFMLPNLYYYKYLVSKFLGNKNFIPNKSMEKLAKRIVWQDILERNGFKIEKVHKYNKFNKSKFMIWMRRLFIPLDYSHHFVFICSKK